MQVDETDGKLLVRIARSLHDMCQPLTVLQCRLEIDLMEADLGSGVTRTAADCLAECERLNLSVARMRALVQEAIVEERERSA